MLRIAEIKIQGFIPYYQGSNGGPVARLTLTIPSPEAFLPAGQNDLSSLAAVLSATILSKVDRSAPIKGKAKA